MPGCLQDLLVRPLTDARIIRWGQLMEGVRPDVMGNAIADILGAPMKQEINRAEAKWRNRKTLCFSA
ncbi:hypothetical protein NDU88_010522 [Pleurodeles waltl]|uniref:Uncharacterized protein n=1 Tax=Pleurodeles waltl TaxID=8319 RepID=A0AAV7S262_PLEWA|nr:hypothetical protein NDU88_010522 [Pleurodeles waltl]